MLIIKIVSGVYISLMMYSSYPNELSSKCLSGLPNLNDYEIKTLDSVYGILVS